MGLDQHAFFVPDTGELSRMGYSLDTPTDLYGLDTPLPEDNEGEVDMVLVECLDFHKVEIAYWRGCKNLHAWFGRLFVEKGGVLSDVLIQGDFVRVTLDDLDRLEKDLPEGLPENEILGEDYMRGRGYFDPTTQFLRRARFLLNRAEMPNKAVYYTGNW